MNSKKQPVKVCHITSAHSVFDERIFHKECISLNKTGCSVVLIAQHDKEEFVDGIHIIPLKKSQSRLKRIFSTWNVLKKSFQQKSDLYHFHDPELILIGIILRLFGKKVIYDVHELVFHSFDEKEWLKYRFVKIIVKYVYSLFEAISIKIFNHLILAEDDYANYYLKKYKKFNKYVIVRNLPITSLIDKVEKGCSVKKAQHTLIYAGGLSSIRGIFELVESMKYVTSDVELLLMGKWNNEKFREKCEQSKGWSKTRYLGFLPLAKVYEYMKASDVGMSMLHPVKNYLTSLPGKVYEYMYCGLPSVISDFPCWRDRFSECSVFADPYNSKDIAKKISYLLENPEMSQELGQRGRELIIEEYSWEKESKKLITLYRDLLNAHKENN